MGVPKRHRCQTPFCRGKPYGTRSLCQKCRLRAWRKAHPLRAAWNSHRACARRRGKLIQWDFEEFSAWAAKTNFMTLRDEGYEIHRRRDEGPYCAANCSCVSPIVNRRMEAVYRKIKEAQARRAGGRRA